MIGIDVTHDPPTPQITFIELGKSRVFPFVAVKLEAVSDYIVGQFIQSVLSRSRRQNTRQSELVNFRYHNPLCSYLHVVTRFEFPIIVSDFKFKRY